MPVKKFRKNRGGLIFQISSVFGNKTLSQRLKKFRKNRGGLIFQILSVFSNKTLSQRLKNFKFLLCADF